MVVVDTKKTLGEILADNGCSPADYEVAVKLLRKLSEDKPALINYLKTAAEQNQPIYANMLQMGGWTGGNEVPNSLVDVLKVLLILTGILFSMTAVLVTPINIVECGMGLNVIIDDPSTYCAGDTDIMTPLIMFAVGLPMLRFCISKGIDAKDAFVRTFNHPFFQIVLALGEVENRDENPGFAALEDLTDALEGGKKHKKRTNKHKRRTNRKRSNKNKH